MLGQAPGRAAAASLSIAAAGNHFVNGSGQTVRLLGINHASFELQGANPPLTRAGYRQAVEDYVSTLNAAGLYVILDLHWTAPAPRSPTVSSRCR